MITYKENQFIHHLLFIVFPFAARVHKKSPPKVNFSKQHKVVSIL